MKHVHWVRITAALALVMGLGACAPLMVGGFVGGAMVATDRRTSGTQLEDEGIELRSANGTQLEHQKIAKACAKELAKIIPSFAKTENT